MTQSQNTGTSNSQIPAFTFSIADLETPRESENIDSDVGMTTAPTQTRSFTPDPASSPTNLGQALHSDNLTAIGRQCLETHDTAPARHHRRTASANAVTEHQTQKSQTPDFYPGLDLAFNPSNTRRTSTAEGSPAFSFPARTQTTTTTANSAPTTEEPSPESELPNPPPSPTILQQAFSLPTVPRFHHLLTHTKILIQQHSYSLQPTTNTLYCTSNPQTSLSQKRFIASLSAAQDSTRTLQPPGPLLEDLRIFSELWNTTIEILDQILSSHAVLSLEAFGWGVYGLASGCVDPDPLALNQKNKLLEALRCLPYLAGKPADGDVQVGYYKDARMVRIGETGRAYDLTSAKRCVHVCAWLLVQGIGKVRWEGVRWGYGVGVCDGWVQHLGWR